MKISPTLKLLKSETYYFLWKKANRLINWDEVVEQEIIVEHATLS